MANLLTRKTMDARLRQVELIMLTCSSTRRAQAEVCEQLGVKPRQARRYMRAVRRIWAIRAERPWSHKRASWLAKLEHILDRALEEGDLKSAMHAMRMLGEFEGLCGTGPVDAGTVPQHAILVDTTQPRETIIATLKGRARELNAANDNGQPRALKAGNG